LKPKRSQSDWKRGRHSALRVVISRGLAQRLSPSVSIVMMKAFRHGVLGLETIILALGAIDARDLRERVKVSSENFVLNRIPGP